MEEESLIYLNVFNNTSNGMAIMEDFKFIDCNDAALRMFGFDTKQQMIDISPSLISPLYQHGGERSHTKMDEAIQLAFENGNHSFEWVHIKQNGSSFWTEVTFTDTSIESRALLLVIWRDIESRKKEEEIYVQNYKTIFNYAKTGLAILDKDTNFLDANEAYLKMLGYSKQELLKYRGLDVSADKDIKSSRKAMSNIYDLGYIENFEKSYIKKDGTIIDVDMSLALLPDNDRVIISVRDITEQKKISRELVKSKNILYEKAHYDDLTMLPNRSLFHDKLKESISEGFRFALLYLDIDNFKLINDAFGHHTGDLFLQEIAGRILKIVRPSDAFSRIGGDEFTIIFNQMRSMEEVINFVKQIFTVIEQEISINEHRIHAFVSIGITICPDHASSCETMMIYADQAMYYVKDNGKNDFVFYNEKMENESLTILQTEKELRDALEKKQLKVFYQPQIDASSNKLIGMEALVRWEHPQKGLLYPSRFLDVAQKAGLLYEIDKYVMLQAMTQVTQWHHKGYNPGKISLNLPVKQIEREGCIESIKSILKETGCMPNWIEFEITENDLMLHPEQTVDTLNKIRSLGIGLVIDDFGIGYSSLSYLKKFPVSKLKIDRSFIKELPHDDEDVVITKAIIVLAESLGITVLAEGVETTEQKEFLLNNNCKFIQGYLYAKPVPAEVLEENFLKH